MDKSRVASTSGRTQRDGTKSSWFGHSLTRCLIGKLSEQEFHARCYIPDSISIQLSNEETLSTNKLPNNMIYFTKEQFATGLHLHIPSLVKQFLFLSRIPPAFIHPNIIRILMGCSRRHPIPVGFVSTGGVVHLHHKMSPKKRFSLSAHIISLQFVTNMSDSNKG